MSPRGGRQPASSSQSAESSVPAQARAQQRRVRPALLCAALLAALAFGGLSSGSHVMALYGGALGGSAGALDRRTLVVTSPRRIRVLVPPEAPAWRTLRRGGGGGGGGGAKSSPVAGTHVDRAPLAADGGRAAAADAAAAAAAAATARSSPPLRGFHPSGQDGERRQDPFAEPTPPPRGFVFGGAADLASHRSAAAEGARECWRHFDFGMLDAWDDAAAVFCAPPDAAVGEALSAAAQPPPAPLLGDAAPVTTGRRLAAALARTAPAGASWLVCRVTQDAHLPPATAPHTLCDGANIVVRWSRMSASQCPRSRPGYKCDGAPVYYDFAPGALSGACARAPAFVEEAFPRDHLRDMLGAYARGAVGDAVADVRTRQAEDVTAFCDDAIDSLNRAWNCTLARVGW